MQFRKKDYIIFYLLFLVLFAMNLMSPVKVRAIIGVLIGAAFPAAILGTVSNLVFKKKNNSL